MTEQQAQELVDDYVEAYNSFDVAGMILRLHPDIIFENVAAGTVMLRTEGRRAFEKQAEQASGFFMERNQHIKAFRFQNDRAEADIDYFAITAADLPNGLKAGTVLRLTGQSIFTFRDGLIAFVQDIS